MRDTYRGEKRDNFVYFSIENVFRWTPRQLFLNLSGT